MKLTEKDKEKLKEVIDTYKCLLSCRKKLPGMSLDSAFSNRAVTELEKEQEWLKGLLS